MSPPVNRRLLPVQLASATRLAAGLALVAILAGCAATSTLPQDIARTATPAVPVKPDRAAAAAAPRTPNAGDASSAVPHAASAGKGIGNGQAGDPPEPLASAPMSAPEGRVLERGGASWYGPRFHGRRTASGERYDMHALTAAHRTLAFGTVVRVRSLVNGREVKVRINDRGPFSRMRIIDLSRAAAAELGMLSLGIKDVLLLAADASAPPSVPEPLVPSAPEVPVFSPG
ncbi:MAG: rare lipoprotein [Polaromonas sp.]|nr:rare lipoprotein [Polaromonas sp.]